MSSGGLSRRRKAVGSSSTSQENDDDDDSRKSLSVPLRSQNGGATTPPASHLHAGSAFEGGNKIAFDPRDLEDPEEETRAGGRMPRLTIVEEVLLLGLKDKQGYISFWNDNISYALRGCIIIELALRRRIAMVKDPNRRRNPLADRLVEVIDDRQTGETILDETLRMMKSQESEKLGVNAWIDLLSGETWNVMKIGFQLKQVRERLMKGLVDKGVLRTEKRNFFLFDMATHPVADVRTKEAIITRVVSILTATTSSVPSAALDKEGVQCRVLRSVCLACTAYTANVLDSAFGRLGYEEREAAFQRCDEIMSEFASWPFGGGGGSLTSIGRKRQGVTGTGNAPSSSIGRGGDGSGRDSILGLISEVRKESAGEEDLCFELVAGVLEVLSKLDSLI